MPTPIYDPRAFVKRLAEAGMPESQADTLASENLLLIAEHLATKDDLKAEFAKMRAEFVTKEEFASFRAEMASKAELQAAFDSLRGEIAMFRAEMKSETTELRGAAAILRADMGTLENRLLIKLGGLMAAMLTLFRLL